MARRKASPSPATISEEVLPKFEAITALTDGFCQQHLNDEYAQMCRRLTAELARKRPTPLKRGRAEVWACGIVRTIGWRGVLILSVLFSPAAVASAEDQKVRISDATTDKDGFLVHTVESPYQAGHTEIKILLPERLEQGRRYLVVYFLPVEKRSESRYGSGLLEVKRHDLHKKYPAIFVAPTFSHWPWYADHPTDPLIRQETYFLKVVVPFIERRYPVQDKASGRLLLGFSKSGWGTFSLLLRHPGIFGKAAAWDAPLMKDKPNQYAMGDIFGTQENFEKYQVARLLEQRVAELRGDKRLILTGYGFFREQHQQFHDLMNKLQIPHEYRDGPERKHDWHTGWVEEALGLLLGSSEDRRR